MNKILDVTFYAALFTIPIDSFPLFPSNSVYRPISAIILAVYFIIYLLGSLSKKKIRKHDLNAALITSLLLIHAIIGSLIFFGKYEHLPKVITTLAIAFLMAVAINDFFARHSPNIPLPKIILVLKRSFMLCAILGVIQVMSKWNIVSYNVSDSLTYIFSYRTVHRLQMLSGEPSWMYRHLLFFFCFFIGVKNFKNRKIYLVLTVFFMAISGTTYGYVLTLIGFLLYVLLFNRGILFNKYVGMGVVLIMIAFSYLYKNSFDQYTVNKIDLVTNVIREPSSIQAYLENDGSAFQRFMNPYIAFKSSKYSYGFGTGLDTYRYVYPKYILSDYSYALKHQTVNDAVEGVNYITPKSLYGKIFSEIGILPFIIFIMMLIFFIYKILNLPATNSNKLFAECAIITLILYGINNDSIIFVNSYFFIYSIYYSTKDSKLIRVNGI